ncbi:hypothetical protein [Pseudomonas asiatica]|uniref:hypothetical protein n=1 Tax=Pseudomonas asiatica TaxID=2219225 RepID=UPI0038781AE6
MSEQKNFEALGRYTDAKERASGLESARHNLAGDIGRMLSSAAMGAGSTVRKFNHASFLTKANELAALNEQLEKAIAEVNSYADQAGKPKMA